MGTWIDFILERYNYWIVIVLMMIGLYTVFARGNLVKKVVGLNLFQTSVFIFYITIGKIAGGTAPIYMGGELDHGGGHGEGAGDDHGVEAGHRAAEIGEHEPVDDEFVLSPPETGDTIDTPSSDHTVDEASLGESGSYVVPTSGADLHSKVENTVASNDLKAALEELGPRDSMDVGSSLHDVSVADANKVSNDALSEIAKPEELGFSLSGDQVDTTVHGAADAAHSVGEIIYTNPLPHVLILTAIVVGVATTAVGLALSVRIREAYGTIEEDELEALDDVAEFGESETAGGAA